MTTVAWAPAAVRDMRSLDPQIARQVRDAVERYAQHGQGDVSPLHGPLKGLFRLRTGDWRVRFELAEAFVLPVLHVGHRAEACR